MKLLRSAFAGILTLLAAATASAQQFPTVPANSVIGRIGITGDTGPSQSIPFTTLTKRLFGATSPNSVLVTDSTGAVVFGGLSNIYYTAQSGVSRTLYSRITQEYNILDYGADPTGVLDSAPAIRLALAAAPYGGTLKVPSGKYLVNSCVNNAVFDFTNFPNKAVNIIGDGWTLKTAGSFTNPSGSIFSLGPSIPTSCDFYHFAPTDLVYNVTLKNFAVIPSAGTFNTPVGRHGLFFEGLFAGGVASVGTITGGSSYTNGTYSGVALTGGTGSGATANITVSGGAVTAVTIVANGTGYIAADTLSASAASIGGTGSGFSVPAAVIWNSYLEGLTIDNVFVDNMAIGYSLYTKSLNNGSGMIALARMQHNKLMQARFENAGDSNVFSHNVLGANATNDSRNVGVYLTQASGATNFEISRNDSVNFNGCITIDQAVKPLVLFNECEIVPPNTSTSLKQIWIAGGVGQVVAASVFGNTLSANVTAQNIVPITIDNAYGTTVKDSRAYVPNNYASVVITSNATNTIVDESNTYYISGALSANGNISDSGTASVIKTVLRSQYAVTSQPGVAPSSGRIYTWVDATDLRLHDMNASAAIGTTSVAKTCTGLQVLTAMNAAGQFTCAAPTGVAGTTTNDNAAGGVVGEYSATSTSANNANATATVTIAAPAVVTWTAHGFCYPGAGGACGTTTGAATAVKFSTTGALPTGITAGTTYYAKAVDANTFNLATTCANALAGTFITTTGTQSGTHTADIRVSMANGVQQDVACISLGAGDWDVGGQMLKGAGATTTVTFIGGNLSLVSNSVDRMFGRRLSFTYSSNTFVPSNNEFTVFDFAPARFPLSATTSVFLVADDAFGTSTMTSSGWLRARRAR